MSAADFIHEVGDQIMANVGVDIDPVPITAWLVLFLTIVAVVSAIIAAVKRINNSFEKRIATLIEERTHPIQPFVNGGLSLSDANVKLDAIKTSVEELDARYTERFDKVAAERKEWRKRYIQDQSRSSKERAAIFSIIKRLIGMNPKEQAEEWNKATESLHNGTLADDYPTERDGNDVY